MLNPRQIRLSNRGIGPAPGQRSPRPPPGTAPLTLAVALGRVIFRVRRRATLSQHRLATRLGLTRSAISRWESGRSAPSVLHLTMLGDLVGRTGSSILNEAEEMIRLAGDATGVTAGAGADGPDGETDHAADD